VHFGVRLSKVGILQIPTEEREGKKKERKKERKEGTEQSDK
jgi:hypothetical protein